MLPKISIVTPSFNQGRYLRDNLLSVRSQTGATVEQILMDGGSTDETAEAIHELGGHLAYWQSARDGGQTDALIQGFARATGEVLGWINSDDYLWDPSAMRHIAEAFARHSGVDMVTGDLVFVSPDGRPIMIDMVWKPTARQLRHYMALPQPSTFWRRSAYERVGGLDRRFNCCMDFDLFQRMSQQGRILRIPHIIAAFRMHPAAKTSRIQETFKREEEECRARATGSPARGLGSRWVNLGIRAGALLAEADAIVKGRRLPSYMNLRIEPMRYYAFRRSKMAP